jgi:hypothetical protein
MMILPIGRYLGMPAGQHTVRSGGRRHELSNEDMMVWALAHGPEPLPVKGVERTVERLIGTGLLAEVRPPGEEFARRVRLMPLAVGLGNSPGRPRAFAVGRPGLPVHTLATEVFYLWSWAGAERSLWDACVNAAADAGSGAGAARDLLGDLLAELPALLPANLVCFDTCFDEAAA